MLKLMLDALGLQLRDAWLELRLDDMNTVQQAVALRHRLAVFLFSIETPFDRDDLPFLGHVRR